MLELRKIYLKDFNPGLVGFIVFGGVDPASKVVVSNSTFGIVFFKEQDCEAWKKVGATPLS
jgi:hypothetical protein